MTFTRFGLVILTLWTTQAVVLAGMANNAPAEVAHFSKLIGSWSTTEESLKQDGSGWQPSKSADWDFYWDFDGYGVRDYYVSPPAAEALEDESKRTRGINLRVYNPKEKQWVMTWLTVAGLPPSGFTATSSDEQIIMLSDAPGTNGMHSRITFFDITDKRFEWKLEWSKDREKWLEVYRIHGVRKAAR